MTLTAKWWSDTKKKFKKAPDTGLKDVLKKYEKTLAEFEKVRDHADFKKTIKGLDAVRKSLSAVVKTAETARKDLKDKKHKGKFDDLSVQVNLGLLDRSRKLAEEFIEKANHEVELKSMADGTDSKDEADYERAQVELSKLRKNDLSLKNFQNITDTIAKMEDLGENVRDEAASSTATMKKATSFTNKLKVIASIGKENDKQRAAYQKAIDDAVKLRSDLLVEFKAAKKAVDDAEKVLGVIESKADAAKGTPAASKLVQMIDIALKKMEDKYVPANDAFKPTNTVRSSTDIRAAKIHTEDSGKFIGPHLTALIKINSPLTKQHTAIIQRADELKATLA